MATDLESSLPARETQKHKWFSPSVALNRFNPPKGIVSGIQAVERKRVRYGFRLGTLGLLIGSSVISEIVEKASIYPLPQTPAWFLGLINVRGNLVPVFDLKIRLELDYPTGSKQWILILDRGEKAVGMLIDELPKTPDVERRLSRLPPLPVLLRPCVSQAYIDNGIIWLEFDHRSFFKSLAGQMMG